jgi:uncharacterized protein DUF3807
MTEQLDIEEEEDGLGYYADGVKRTLTDEQIRIFRHSEIYSLLRARQLEPSMDSGTGEDPSTITSPPLEVDSQCRSLSSKTAESPNIFIAQSGEDDTMKQNEDISGAPEQTSSARRPKNRKGEKRAGKGRMLGYDQDQLPINETDPSVRTSPTQAGAFARRILSYDD